MPSEKTEMIDVTPQAAARIKVLLQKNGVEGGLRLGVVGGGCSGLSYKFKLEPQPKPTDSIYEHEGVKVFVDPKSHKFLDGMILDYTESLMESAFVFRNPNAKRHCSCGKSFLT